MALNINMTDAELSILLEKHLKVMSEGMFIPLDLLYGITPKPKPPKAYIRSPKAYTRLSTEFDPYKTMCGWLPPAIW